MRISIDSNEVQSKSGMSKNGQPYEIATQTGYADLGKRYPSEVKIRLKDPAKPWPVGEYTVDTEKCAYVNKYGSLTLSEELHLVELGKPVFAKAI
jgi:hypothetical protein